MGKITIFGAGICGLSTAAILTCPKPDDPDWKPHQITIVARDLPGDEPSQDWASPWACAGWVAMGGSHKEKVLQIAALNYLLTLADKYPDSSVRRVELTAKFPPHVGLDDGVVWASKYVPKFQVVSSGVDGSDVCVRYGSVVLTPRVFLPWLRGRLEKRGVVFERVGEVKRLGELKDMGHDVLVNASGLGSMTLEDVKDGKMMMDRTYCTVVRSWFEGAFVRQGEGYYTYIFARGDGTAVVGGVSHPVDEPVKSMEDVHRELFQHASEAGLEDFPSSDPEHYEIVEDLVGIRPLRPAGVVARNEVVDWQKVVQAYGTTAGGYIYSFGLGQEVAKCVEQQLRC